MKNLARSIMLLLLCWGSMSHHAVADPQSQSFSTWQLQQNQLKTNFTVSSREVTRLGPWRDKIELETMLLNYLRDRLLVADQSGDCALTDLTSLEAAAGTSKAELTFTCPSPPDQLTIGIGAFFDVIGSHIHFARLHHAGEVHEVLFTGRNKLQQFNLTSDSIKPDAEGGFYATLSAYFWLGIVHILEGLDHIAFLLGLLLLGGRPRDVILIVTGFTIGHSITLSLAVLDIVQPNISFIEALIGFTVALVAAENIAARTSAGKDIAIGTALVLATLTMVTAISGIGPPLWSLVGLVLFSFCYLQLGRNTTMTLKLRPIITVLFGLVHGFGFADVLLDIGLPTTGLVTALLGFNLGVEAGQIIIVLTLWLGLWLTLAVLNRVQSASNSRFLAHLPSFSLNLASAGLVTLGMYWFVGRAWIG